MNIYTTNGVYQIPRTINNTIIINDLKYDGRFESIHINKIDTLNEIRFTPVLNIYRHEKVKKFFSSEMIESWKPILDINEYYKQEYYINLSSNINSRTYYRPRLKDLLLSEQILLSNTLFDQIFNPLETQINDLEHSIND